MLRNLDVARELAPDAVLSMTTVIPWGGLTAALLGRPHLWYITDFGGGARTPPCYFLPFEEIRRAIMDSDRLLVVSQAVRDRIFADAGETPTVVYPHLEPPARRPPADAPFFRRPGATRLAVFGHVREEKGQPDAIRAVAELARRGLEVELALVGHDGALDVRALIAELGLGESVHVLGEVEDQHAVMAACDVVVMPSLEETFSLVCLETALHGKPLVATRVGGVVELVHDGVNGLTVRPGEWQGLADAVERLIRDPALARRLAEEGRRAAEGRFTADGFGGAVRRELDLALAGARRRPAPAPLLAPLLALAEERGGLGEERSALAADVADLRERRTELEGQVARISERSARLDDELARLAEGNEALQGALAVATAELAAERDRCQEERRRREEAQRLAARRQQTLEAITATRGWRLLDAYWRLAARWRNRLSGGG